MLPDTRRTRLALAGLLIAALALLGVNYQDSSSSLVTVLRGAAGWAAGGAERAASSVTRPVASLLRAGQTPRVAATIAGLQRQLVRMRAELSTQRQANTDDRQLSRLLQTAGAGGYRVVAASVIAFGQGYQQTVTVDAGTAAGVRTQQTVLDAGGLVGQVIAVTSGTCTVLLATDPRSVVGVRLAPSGQIGWVAGAGQPGPQAGLLRLQVLSETVRLAPGEQLVTAASVGDRPFVPGVPVGVITAVLHRAGGLTAQALVRPYASPTSLNVVGIIIAPPRRDPRFSVLPARPATASARRPGAAAGAAAGRSGVPAAAAAGRLGVPAAVAASRPGAQARQVPGRAGSSPPPGG